MYEIHESREYGTCTYMMYTNHMMMRACVVSCVLRVPYTYMWCAHAYTTFYSAL